MISKYKTNTQPLYVLTDLEGNSLMKKSQPLAMWSVGNIMETRLKAGVSN
jgi:thiol:disulfide interchange protein DsbD